MREFSWLAAGKWVIAAAVGYWLQIPDLMRLLLMMMAVDYVSGFAAAVKARQVSSEIGGWGLVKKVMTFVLLILSHRIELSSGREFHIEEIGSLGFVVNEAVSIIENAAKLDVPIPAGWLEVLLSVQRLWARRSTVDEVSRLGKED